MPGACIAGAGIAQVMALGVQDLIDNGQLIDLFPDWPGEIFPLYALTLAASARREGEGVSDFVLEAIA